MKLNQFLSIMEQYFSHKVLSGSGSGRVTKADKLKAYLNAFVSTMDSDNPIEKRKDGFLLKVYNGVESLPVDCASYIKENLDYYTFELFSEDLSEDARNGIISQFATYNFTITFDNFEKDISRVLDTILYYVINVKPSASIRDAVFIGHNQVKIGGKTVNLLDKLVPTEAIIKNEIRYVDALLRVYAQSQKFGSISLTDLKSMHPRYEKHFKLQRENYFNAESVLHQIRDVFPDGEYEFNEAKADLLSGIEITIMKEYKNALERVDSTMQKVVDITFSKNILTRDNNGIIGNPEKQGMVHMLVNDGKIEWVVDYDTDI